MLEDLAISHWRSCPAKWTARHAALDGCEGAAIAHFLHTARSARELLAIKRQRQLADRTVVLLRSRAALLHQHQLVPGVDALLASPYALPPRPLLHAERAVRQLPHAGATDFHDVRAGKSVRLSDPAYEALSGLWVLWEWPSITPVPSPVTVTATYHAAHRAVSAVSRRPVCPVSAARSLTFPADRECVVDTDTAADNESCGKQSTSDMKICGACVRELPDGSFSVEQRARRQSIRRCEECVAAGNQLVLMKKGRTRSEGDDCPICQLPLPLDAKQWMFKSCCMKRVCNGCAFNFEAIKRGMRDCPFCRATMPEESQALAMVQSRVDAGDPVAIYFLGNQYDYGLERDVTRAVELYERAAELGVNEAHHNLGTLYAIGADVEKDMAKAFRHYEAAAMGGDVHARHNLGCIEGEAGNCDLGLQHILISAKLGNEDSLNTVKRLFMAGLATKADYAAALRGYQNSVEEMSSPDRDQAKAVCFWTK
ncbi:hypothetical protein THAOC_07417 [Thalassiosira oceanica]|uniref:RING-type domain-containing protein n=1 Tax=Thalassiosira oceanica TaxID=159749 RepID=K0T1Z9_THAOC|nr:hypothetical protein THAOC_07417 [Thalassiosira oceanica]|eukprot:EJK71169.1 hypothetical protein THAOC_07417 [Thalassiosira oceanica]